MWLVHLKWCLRGIHMNFLSYAYYFKALTSRPPEEQMVVWVLMRWKRVAAWIGPTARSKLTYYSVKDASPSTLDISIGCSTHSSKDLHPLVGREWHDIQRGPCIYHNPRPLPNHLRDSHIKRFVVVLCMHLFVFSMQDDSSSLYFTFPCGSLLVNSKSKPPDLLVSSVITLVMMRH